MNNISAYVLPRITKESEGIPSDQLDGHHDSLKATVYDY